jgi:hypothetical protein
VLKINNQRIIRGGELADNPAELLDFCNRGVACGCERHQTHEHQLLAHRHETFDPRHLHKLQLMRWYPKRSAFVNFSGPRIARFVADLPARLSAPDNV